MNIAIIGGGFTGLTAALDLLNQGHNVAVFEAAPQVGGLASGFKAPGWDWSLERFYHHIFTTDKAIIALAKQIGVGDMLFFNEQITAFHCAEHGAHPVTPVDLLRYPHLPFVDRVRYGISGAQLKLRSDWQRLERTTAERHLTSWAGKRAYQQLWITCERDQCRLDLGACEIALVQAGLCSWRLSSLRRCAGPSGKAARRHGAHQLPGGADHAKRYPMERARRWCSANIRQGDRGVRAGRAGQAGTRSTAHILAKRTRAALDGRGGDGGRA